MSYSQFIDLLSSFWGLISGIYFSIGVLKTSDELIKNISSLFFASGEWVAVVFAQQKVDFQFGIGYLFLSFLSGLVVKLLPALETTPAFEWFWPAVPFAFTIAVAPVLVLAPLRKQMLKKAETKARNYNRSSSSEAA